MVDEEDPVEKTIRYSDLMYQFTQDTNVEALETGLGSIFTNELLQTEMESANQFADGIEYHGVLYKGKEAFRIVYKNSSGFKRIIDFSDVYDDLNEDRDNYKDVFVRTTDLVYDDNGELIPEISTVKILIYSYQNYDREWKLYSYRDLELFLYDGESHTIDYNGKPIEFTQSKEYEVLFDIESND